MCLKHKWIHFAVIIYGTWAMKYLLVDMHFSSVILNFYEILVPLTAFAVKPSEKSNVSSVIVHSVQQDEKICFIMDESNVLDSSFLERMNTLLANGEVPGLFEGDEYSTLMTQCKEGAVREGLMLDSAEELYKWFTQQVGWIDTDDVLPVQSSPFLKSAQKILFSLSYRLAEKTVYRKWNQCPGYPCFDNYTVSALQVWWLGGWITILVLFIVAVNTFKQAQNIKINNQLYCVW